MAQHASPNEAGHEERERAHFTRSSIRPVMTLCDRPPRPSDKTSPTTPITIGRLCGRLRSIVRRGTTLEADPTDRRGGVASGRDHSRVDTQVAVALEGAPVETTLGHLVDEGEEEHQRETEDRPEAEGAESTALHGVGVEEDDLDVEHNEEHRDDVEADRKPL